MYFLLPKIGFFDSHPEIKSASALISRKIINGSANKKLALLLYATVPGLIERDHILKSSKQKANNNAPKKEKTIHKK